MIVVALLRIDRILLSLLLLALLEVAHAYLPVQRSFAEPRRLGYSEIQLSDCRLSVQLFARGRVRSRVRSWFSN